MKNLILLLFIASSISCGTQKKAAETVRKQPNAVLNTAKENSIATWSFKKENSDKANHYLITANLVLAKDWHIFDFKPGGDGLLIAPDFTFDDKDITIISKKAEGKLVTAKLDGMDDDVRFYENQVSFKLLVRSNKKTLNGSVYYQLCDHEKCLVPTEESFIFSN